RMYEGMLSLMQMAKTSGALARHADARLPYISVLTNPTTAGVMASYASLGDIIIAEPKSMIGFAGPRVIKETTHQDLPKGFQTAEFLEEHGLIDQIVHRKKLRPQIAEFLRFFAPTAALIIAARWRGFTPPNDSESSSVWKTSSDCWLRCQNPAISKSPPEAWKTPFLVKSSTSPAPMARGPSAQ